MRQTTCEVDNGFQQLKEIIDLDQEYQSQVAGVAGATGQQVPLKALDLRLEKERKLFRRTATAG